MSNQESPDVRIVPIRLRQELYRQLEILKERRGYAEISVLIRSILVEAVRDIKLTAEDYREIARRVDAATPRIEQRNRERKAAASRRASR